MTGPGSPGPDPDVPGGPDPGPESDEFPGLRTFSLEGRHAAGLYLVGWLASLLGGATILVVLLAQSSDLPGAILLGIGTLLLALGLAAAAGSQAIERQAAAELGYRGPSPFLLFGSTVALTLFLELLALPPMRALGIATGSTLEALIDLLILNGSALLVVALLVVGSGGLSWWEMLLPRRVLGGAVSPNALLADVGAGMLVGIPVLFLTIVLGAALIALLGVTPPSPLPVAQSPAGALVNIV
ncbi:MAG: hypothetical protein ACRDGQ_06550, partial [Candidatus Limnocylindrales bacterium]